MHNKHKQQPTQNTTRPKEEEKKKRKSKTQRFPSKPPTITIKQRVNNPNDQPMATKEKNNHRDTTLDDKTNKKYVIIKFGHSQFSYGSI